MRRVLAWAASLAFVAGPALAAGGGAGAGGAGHQRSINSGLPPGELGPPGAPNNRTAAARQPPMAHDGSPRRETLERP